MRENLKVFVPILLIRDPKVVLVEAILISVTDYQCGLSRVAVKGDVVGDEAVA